MRIGIDLGGTKIEGVLLGPSGAVERRFRRPSPQGDYQATIAAILKLVNDLEVDQETPATVGIGIPGALSPVTGKVKNANSTWLIGQALDQDLSRTLKRPVRLANDANCFALSEAQDGAGANAETLFGVILGTGVGGGLIIKGHAASGRNAIAGEWGHNPLPWPNAAESPGPLCYCGKRGCIETFLSGPGLVRDHQDNNQRPTAGQPPSAEAIIEAAEAGDRAARASLARYEDRLARSLATVINIVDPDVIVLGGGLSNLSRLYQSLPEILPKYVFSDHCDTPLLPPRHGDSSGVRGAAWLWTLEEAQALRDRG